MLFCELELPLCFLVFSFMWLLCMWWCVHEHNLLCVRASCVISAYAQLRNS